MTLSIELLPAPFGPMIARTSCSSTLKETLVNACTPPKRREIDSSSRIGAPIGKARLTVAGLRRSNNPPRFHRRNDNCVSYFDVGLCSSCLAVPMCVSNAHLRTTLVHGVDQRVIKIRDGTATQHAGVRKETVAGGEFLVGSRTGGSAILTAADQRQRCIHLADTLGDQFINFVARSQVCGRCTRYSSCRPTGPAAMSMSTSAQTLSRPLPKTTASLMYGNILSRFSAAWAHKACRRLGLRYW